MQSHLFTFFLLKVGLKASMLFENNIQYIHIKWLKKTSKLPGYILARNMKMQLQSKHNNKFAVKNTGKDYQSLGMNTLQYQFNPCKFNPGLFVAQNLFAVMYDLVTKVITAVS